MKFVNTFFFLIVFFFASQAQERQPNFAQPMRIPIVINASFGELRNNAFHAGIDYGTNRAEGVNIHSIDDGYVSRIGVSPIGFGKALYIAHPSGHTSVYAHLREFSPEIDNVVKNYQYENQRFRVDFHLEENQIPIKRGQLIGKSGNTGSSGGPHLHFEVRDTETQEILNPMRFPSFGIVDTRPPTIREIAVFPIEGVANGRTNRIHFPASQNPPLINAWGTIGLAVKAYDAINNSTRTLGINEIRLFVDNEQVFNYKMERYAFHETRYINSFIDFEDWRRNKSFFMKSFVEPNNRLRLFETNNNRGLINISEERDYRIRYEVLDSHNNKATFSFVIRGRRADIPPPPSCRQTLFYNWENIVHEGDFRAVIPPNVLYTNLCLNYSRRPSATYLSDIHQLQDNFTPLHDSIDIFLPVDARRIADTSKLLALKLNGTQKPTPFIGKYENGKFHFRSREFGSYAAVIDTTPPQITPQPNAPLRFKITDDLSGIDTYNGFINGVWALFEYDAKNDLLFHRPDNRVSLRKPYTLRLEVTDKVGNKANYELQVK